MKVSYLYIIFFISLFSCSSKKELIGTWYGIENENSIFVFSPDSLTLYTPNPQKILWNANNNEIKFNYLPNSSSEYKKINLKYEITNDTLITYYNGIKVMYLKANNYVEFLNKKYNLKFALPKNEKLREYQGMNENYALKVFIGKQKGKRISRTEKFENLNNLNKQAIDFINNFGTYEEVRIHYQLFADKNIPKNEMIKIYNKLRKTKIKKIYRMYERANEYSNFKFEYIK